MAEAWIARGRSVALRDHGGAAARARPPPSSDVARGLHAKRPRRVARASRLFVSSSSAWAGSSRFWSTLAASDQAGQGGTSPISPQTTQLACTGCRRNTTRPLKRAATTGGLLGLSLLPRYAWWCTLLDKKHQGCPTMQPDEIILVGAGAITFGWYAVLHWAVGLF